MIVTSHERRCKPSTRVRSSTRIVLVLAVTFAVQRMVVIARSQRMLSSGQNEMTGLT